MNDDRRNDRVDARLDTVVNKGLAAAMLVNLSAGLKIMSDGGVPPDVAVRVCLEPQHRRATDWKR